LSTTFLSSCKKEEGCTDPSALNYDADAEKDNNSCQYQGKATFWNHESDGYCNVAVSINGLPIGVITLDYTGAPECGANGAVTYEANPGAYSYTATEEDCDGDGLYATWAGTINVDSEGCLTLRLTE
jgi:hypothetical protein